VLTRRARLNAGRRLAAGRASGIGACALPKQRACSTPCDTLAAAPPGVSLATRLPIRPRPPRCPMDSKPTAWPAQRQSFWTRPAGAPRAARCVCSPCRQACRRRPGSARRAGFVRGAPHYAAPKRALAPEHLWPLLPLSPPPASAFPTPHEFQRGALATPLERPLHGCNARSIPWCGAVGPTLPPSQRLLSCALGHSCAVRAQIRASI
jgi:hypothetical protein